MTRTVLPTMLLGLAAVAMARAAAAAPAPPSAPAAAPQEPVDVYESPRDYARAGDFQFRYPRELFVLQDFVYSDATVPAPRHTIVLRHKDADATGDLRSIEINMLRSLKQRMSCDDYSACRVVDGVVIGTNSEDPEFLKAFNQVVASFKRR